MKYLTLIKMAIITWALSQTAYGHIFTSQEQQTQLIELYTSEGCRSCPPADNWLSNFKSDPKLWQSIIPIAFHVDYWDQIGWVDPFGQARFSQRQYDYYHLDHIASVYTPAILLNGHEWRAWRNNAPQEQHQTEAGILQVHLTDNNIDVHYDSSLPRNQTLVLNIAQLGFDLTSQIQAGENSGKQLNHDFVVIGYKTAALQPSQSGFIAKAVALPTPSHASSRYALAVWVNTFNDPTPLQATGGWLSP